MKHIKIYEQFAGEMESPMTDVHFETESSDIRSTSDAAEGSYVISFTNSDGEKTTVEVGSATDPEFIGDKMVSMLDMISNSSSDGKMYGITGYYKEIPDSGKQYTLEKVLIEEI
jgi:hypothetical protein